VRARDVVVLTLLVALVLAWPLAAPGIGTHGEAREGLVVQDLVARGHWVLPLRNGELPSKPPLFHWIAA
jgi:4-amino-4-deoxy-L-arabinose transferase-like glycosyltransferase